MQNGHAPHPVTNKSRDIPEAYLGDLNLQFDLQFGTIIGLKTVEGFGAIWMAAGGEIFGRKLRIV